MTSPSPLTRLAAMWAFLDGVPDYRRLPSCVRFNPDFFTAEIAGTNGVAVGVQSQTG